AGQVAVYEGGAQQKIRAGKEKTESQFQATLLQLAKEGSGKKELLVVRLLTGGEKPLVSFDKVTVGRPRDSGPLLEALDDVPPELEEASSSLNQHLALDVFPSFPLPAQGPSSRSEETVGVLGLADVKLPLVVSSKKDGSQTEIIRSLPEGVKA